MDVVQGNTYTYILLVGMQIGLAIMEISTKNKTNQLYHFWKHTQHTQRNL